MLFKGPLWEFFQRPNLEKLLSPGIYFIKMPDSYSEHFLVNFLKREGVRLRALMGNELIEDWIEENWLTPSLFSSEEKALVLDCENISKRVWTFLEENFSHICEDSLYFFCRNWPSSLNRSCENENIFFIETTSPMFWQSSEYIEWMAKNINFSLSSSCVEYLSQSLPMLPSVIYQKLNFLKLAAEEEILTLEKLKSLIFSEKFDRFQLALLFSQKKISLFWKQILNESPDKEALREFFTFMQSHLFKLLNPEYSQQKNKLSSYDKNIVKYAKDWKRSELKEWMKTFSFLEKKTKTNSWDFEYLIKGRSWNSLPNF